MLLKAANMRPQLPPCSYQEQQKGWQYVKALHLMLGNGANATANIFCLCWGAGNTQKVFVRAIELNPSVKPSYLEELSGSTSLRQFFNARSVACFPWRSRSIGHLADSVHNQHGDLQWMTA